MHFMTGLSEAQDSISFLQDTYTADVNETVASKNIPRPSKGFVTVSCLLYPSNTSADISYSIVDPIPNSIFPFFVDPTNGQLQAVSDLDYETDTMFEFTVQCAATFNASLVNVTTLNIQILPINDGPPMIPINFIFLIITEATPPGTVLVSTNPRDNPFSIYTATDNDRGPHGNIFFSISLDTNGTYFSFNATYGSLTLRQSIDRDTISSGLIREVLTICDSDPARPDCPNLELSIIVMGINDNRPVFSQDSYSATISEGAGIGTNIINATCTDADKVVGTFGRIELIEQSPSPDFADVDGTTGFITTSRSLDYELANTHQLRLRCFDNGVPPMEAFAIVEVNVTDINDNSPTVESDTNDAVLVNDISPVDTVIFSLFCSDLDSGQNSEISYSIANVSLLDLFSVNSVTGNVTITRDLTLQSGVYFTEHVLVLECADNGQPALSSRTELQVNIYKNDDAPPTIDAVPNGIARVSEGAILGAPVITITAADTTSPSLTYSLKNESSTGTFVIDRFSGTISTNSSLDRETVDTYFVCVVVTEVRVAPGDEKSSFVDLTILIDDENDNRPSCDDMPEQLLNASTYSYRPITILNCTDRDSGVNSELRFSLSNLPLISDGEFVLNEQTGEFGFTGSITKAGVFTITVVVSDLGVPPASIETSVRVVVIAAPSVSFPQMYVIIISLIGAGLLLVVLLLLVLCCCCCCCRMRMHTSKDLLRSVTVM